MKWVQSSELGLGDRFWFDGQLWQHCGWYSAVAHIAALSLRTGEKRVISRHNTTVQLYEDTFWDGLGI